MKNKTNQACSQVHSIDIQGITFSQVDILQQQQQSSNHGHMESNQQNLQQHMHSESILHDVLDKQQVQSEHEKKLNHNQHTKHKVQAEKQVNICGKHNDQKGKLTKFICLEDCCISTKLKQGPALFCQLCIDEQKHKGHLFCTVAKFNTMVVDYRAASQQIRKYLCSTIQQVRTYMEQCLASFQDKVNQFLTNLPEELELQEGDSKCNPHHQQGKCNDFRSMQIWRDIAVSKQPQLCIANITNLQKQFVLEQIQYISDSFKQTVKQSTSNLDFFKQFKDLMFNPDDMHPGEVGLSLNRNQLEIVQNVRQQQSDDHSINANSCKLAFTQTPLTSSQSKSFQVQSIRHSIMIGCVEESDHTQINQNIHYQNCHNLTYGIEVRHDGSTMLYLKGLQPKAIIGNIGQGDIVDLVYLCYQKIIAIIKYGAISTISSGADTSTQVQIIATISVDLPKQVQFYTFAGVAGPGDCIRLVDRQQLCKNLALQTELLKCSSENHNDSIQTDQKITTKCNHCARVQNFISKQKRRKQQTRQQS